jgi:2-oxoglutarate dehydrogenase E2 component (dihydrolipoamide succinyltransferase)
VLGDILATQGATVAIGSLLAALNEGGGVSVAAPAPAAAPPPKAEALAKPAAAAKPAPAKAASAASAPPPAPAARKVLAEAQIDPDAVVGSGRRGQVLKEDALAAVAAKKPALAESPVQSPAPQAERRESPSTPVPVPIQELRVPTTMGEPGREERVKMSRLRQTIARRLKDAQNTAAMLTTFNDVDMSAVMALRAQYKDLFEKRHGVKLGFMGFFVKACVQALREIPAVNAEIDGEDIIYKNYYHIGVAVGTDRGLVVPVLREADRLSLAETEITIAEYGRRARDGKLSIEDMQGGTFTISNGGVYGSMLSTPILNAPQSGILGMHRIEERPVVKNGQIVARPMMYLALSYDHRVVDGKEAVTFLVRVKECLEDPQRFMLEL